MDSVQILKEINKILYSLGIRLESGESPSDSIHGSFHVQALTNLLNKKFNINLKTEIVASSSLRELVEIIGNIIDKPNNRDFTMNDQNRLNERKLNIVVVGRSGVGKSSFLNYAAGKDVFETGTGDPVTQAYFDKIDVKKPSQNVTYSLFDTKGIEQGNTDEWKKAIYDEIDRRDKSDNMYDWIHTLIYCIDASSKRIQPFEIETIKELSNRGSVLVLLTKKDLVSEGIIQSLKNQITSEIGDKVQILSVCSVSTRTRRGVSEKTGLEEVLKVSFLGLWEKLAIVLPREIIHKIGTIKTTLTVDCDLADLFAYLGLVAYHELEDGKRIYPSYLIFDYPTKKDYESDNRNVSFSAFKKAEEEIENYLPVKSVIGANKVDILVDTPFFHFFENGTQIDHDFLNDTYYCLSIGTYLRLISELFYETAGNFKSFQDIFNKSRNSHTNTISQALAFYNDVNRRELPILKNHKTQRAIANFNEINYDELAKECEKKALSVKKDIDEVLDCFWSSGSERRAAESSYTSFQNWLSEKSNVLYNLLESFRNAYEAEIHAYGQYCLREDEVASPRHSSCDQQLIEFIKDLFIDGNISSRDRMLIERKAEKLGICERSTIDRLILVATKNR